MLFKRRGIASNQSGKNAEQWALDYLAAQGLKFETRNFRSPRGEIDLIMWEEETLVFIEVRLRNTHKHGSAADSITSSKQQRVIQTAQQFLQAEGLWDKISCRFDAICLDKDPDNSNQYRVEWVRSAFSL